MSTSTGTYTATRTQTAVHLTDAIMGTFSTVLAHLGLADSYLAQHWQTVEGGLTTWIEEGTLADVRLEIGTRDDPDAVFEVPIKYRFTGEGDREFVTSQARLTRALAKYESVPGGSSYRVVVSHTGAHRHVDGWAPTTAADTSRLSSFRVGSLASGPDASASMAYLSRNA